MGSPHFEYRESSSAPIPAQRAGEELERIRLDHDGKLTPGDVVAAARPAKAPLHPCFEWDDKAAGKSWREHQARNLIRSVRVVYSETESAPAFVHIKPEAPAEKPYYQSVEVAVQNVSEWDRAVEGMAAKLRGAKQALDDLVRVAGQSENATHAVAVATIAKAFSLIDETLSSMRH